MKPSPAASALLASLSLPPGAAVIWPAMRDGQTKLIVRLSKQFWDRSARIPVQFEGYSVVVELNQSLAAQASTTLPSGWTTIGAGRPH